MQIAVMLNIDPSSEFGARVQRRLHDEELLWLTTVDRTGTPRSVPVRFFWDGEAILIYSEPGKLKVRNIERNPRVNLHFNSGADGNNIIVLTGGARTAPDAPLASNNPPYLSKYGAAIRRIGLIPESFDATYATAFIVSPERVSGH